jgi:hypothetical protein
VGVACACCLFRRRYRKNQDLADRRMNNGQKAQLRKV